MIVCTPPGPIKFPAIDRPSKMFLKQFERAMSCIGTDAIDAPFKVELAGCVEDNFANCVASLGVVSRFHIFTLGEARGVIAIPDCLAGELVEFAYGGDGSEALADGRALTALEIAYAVRAAAATIAAMLPAFADADVAIVGDTDTPNDHIAPGTQALACGFAIEATGRPLGVIGLIVPLKALAQIENRLGSGDDPHWTAGLERALAQTRTPVRAVLARPILNAGAVARFKLGDVIPIHTLNEIALIAGGFCVATGVADARDGRAAIKVNKTEFTQ
jgi:flagellar motor switch protein FliM